MSDTTICFLPHARAVFLTLSSEGGLGSDALCVSLFPRCFMRLSLGSCTVACVCLLFSACPGCVANGSRLVLGLEVEAVVGTAAAFCSSFERLYADSWSKLVKEPRITKNLSLILKAPGTCWLPTSCSWERSKPCSSSAALARSTPHAGATLGLVDTGLVLVLVAGRSCAVDVVLQVQTSVTNSRSRSKEQE